MNFKVEAPTYGKAWSKARKNVGKNYTVTRVYWLGSRGATKIWQCSAHRR